MTPRLPRLDARRLEKVLLAAGFWRVRQKGSHRIYRDAAGRRVVVPHHGGKVLPIGTLKAILKDAGLDPEDLH
jgi:predicted RNA binding protein YcfA (HicA-like mRNA interferase family)